MNALVTGASSGLGKAIYEHLQQTCDPVIGASRRGPDHEIDLSHIEIAGIQTSDWNTLRAKGPFDVMVINHGILLFDELKEAEKISATNFWSYWLMLSVGMVKANGCIILNASVSGVIGDKDLPYYAALKAAVINLTQSYAKILMPQRIRVNCFSCGFFQTNLVEGETPDELVAEIPMGREAKVDEILPVIDMLIDCTYITGQNIIVDGGLSL